MNFEGPSPLTSSSTHQCCSAVMHFLHLLNSIPVSFHRLAVVRAVTADERGHIGLQSTAQQFPVFFFGYLERSQQK